MSKVIRTVHRPVLTDEERARRMKAITAAAEQLLIEIYTKREEKNDDH